MTSTKSTITNCVSQLKIAITALPTLTADGVVELRDVTLETKSIAVVLKVVLMDGSSERECAPIKSELEASLISPQKYIFAFILYSL